MHLDLLIFKICFYINYLEQKKVKILLLFGALFFTLQIHSASPDLALSFTLTHDFLAKLPSTIPMTKSSSDPPVKLIIH